MVFRQQLTFTLSPPSSKACSPKPIHNPLSEQLLEMSSALRLTNDIAQQQSIRNMQMETDEAGGC